MNRPTPDPSQEGSRHSSASCRFASWEGERWVHGPMRDETPWGLPLNQPGHRIGACLGKAALKTHALQTLRDRRAFPNRAKRLECVRFIGAFRPARDGQRFMVPMHAKKRKEALHEPGGKHNVCLRLG